MTVIPEPAPAPTLPAKESINDRMRFRVPTETTSAAEFRMSKVAQSAKEVLFAGTHSLQRSAGKRCLPATAAFSSAEPLRIGQRNVDIASAVRAALQWSAAAPKASIKVQVDDGWVTLTGNVEWQFQRQAAADNVRYLLGVTGVSDHIVITVAVSHAGQGRTSRPPSSDAQWLMRTRFPSPSAARR